MSEVSLGRFGDRRLERGVFLHDRLARVGGQGLRVRCLGGTRAGDDGKAGPTACRQGAGAKPVRV